MFQFGAFEPAGPAGIFEQAVAGSPLDPAIDRPRAEIVAGASVIGAFVLVAAAWAALMPLDAAVVAPGVVKVVGERQKVQSIGEGVISAIRVAEGEHVAAGQSLVEFAAPEIIASERSLASRVIGLRAEIAGLEAEQRGFGAIVAPPEFALYRGADAVLAQDTLAMETARLARRREVASAARSVLSRRVGQVHDQIAGTAAQRAALRQQQILLDQEVGSIRELAAKGYASRNRLLETERSAAELAGNSGTAAAEMARLQSSAGEARLQIIEQDSEREQANVTRMRDARAELASLAPQWDAARTQVERMQLRAPVSGSVVALSVHTVGGVAERGQTLLEIVPDERALTVEAEIPAADGNEVAVGKSALLRVPGLHGRNVPQLHGVITTVAADAQTDERSGRSYYTIKVRVQPAELSRLAQAVGRTNVLRPGNPIQVVIGTRARSALQYWLDPLTQTMGSALREQ
jgi:HlyD family type I secretion membrane fusion protein